MGRRDLHMNSAELGADLRTVAEISARGRSAC